MARMIARMPKWLFVLCFSVSYLTVGLVIGLGFTILSPRSQFEDDGSVRFLIGMIVLFWLFIVPALTVLAAIWWLGGLIAWLA